LIKRGTSPYKYYWCLPGGVVREGESPEETCIREVKEETGLDVTVSHEVGRVRGNTPIFLCRRTGGALRSKPPESIAVGWFPLEKVLSMFLPPFISDFMREMKDAR